MKDFFLIRTLLYPVFFLYPFVAFQFVCSSVNIPFSDILAMWLGVFFAAVILGEVFLRARLPELNLRGAWIFALFLLIALLSIANSSYAGASVKYFFRHPFFYFAIYFTTIGSIIIWQGRKRLSLLYHLLCASSLLIALISLSTSFYRTLVKGDVFGVTVIPYLTNNHKTLAITLALNLPFLIFMSGSLRKDWRLIYYSTIALSMLAIILSFSKAAWLSLALISGSFGLRHFKRFGILRPVVAITAVAAIATAGYFLFEFLSSSKEVVKGEESRYFLAWLALKMFQAHPLTGSGIGSFVIELKEYADALSAKGFPSLADLEAHGLVFKLLSETGLAGFIAFSLFFLYLFLSLRKIYVKKRDGNDAMGKQLIYGCLVALVTLYFINSFFGTDTYTPRMWFPLAFISANGYILARGSEDAPWD